jgi:DNA-binding NarL/FixJ family response regulator
VLVADDHTPTREEVRRILENDGRFAVCATAANASEAVWAAIRQKPDVTLIDIRIPGSGLAAAWEITARLPRTKIVILTVSDEDRDLFAALRAGADGYLLKGMDLRRLPDELQGVCVGEAAMPRALVTRVLKEFHGREPRWRSPAQRESAGRRLTSREWEVLELLAQGRSTAKIADMLVLSSSAVRVHITSIVRKLKVANRDAAAELFRKGARGDSDADTDARHPYVT